MSSVGAPLLAELLALGLATGFVAGLLGIGGGMLMVPFLTLILTHRQVAPELAVKMAIATSMSTILFTSLSSVQAHQRRGAVRWQLVRTLAPGIVLGGLLAGAGAFRFIKGQWLALSFALFISVSAARMLRPPRQGPEREMPGLAGQIVAGGGIGFLAGLVGAGGAFVSVPFMTRRGVPIHQAIGTSAALGFPIALAGTAGYVISGRALPETAAGAWGYIFLPALAAIAAASVLAAPLGARLAHASDVTLMRRLFAFLLFGLAAYMALHALRG